MKYLLLVVTLICTKTYSMELSLPNAGINIETNLEDNNTTRAINFKTHTSSENSGESPEEICRKALADRFEIYHTPTFQLINRHLLNQVTELCQNSTSNRRDAQFQFNLNKLVSEAIEQAFAEKDREISEMEKRARKQRRYTIIAAIGNLITASAAAVTMVLLHYYGQPCEEGN